MTNSTDGNVGSVPPAPPKRSDLKTRTASAVVLGPVVLLLVWAGGWWFAGLLALGAALAAREWLRMLGPGVPRTVRRLVSGGLLLVPFIQATYGAPWAVALALALGFGIASVSERSVRGLALVGVPYVGLSFAALAYLRSDAAGGLAIFLFLLTAVWACDIGAYAGGRTIGGPKLAPRISPSKTWAGLISGAFAAALVGLAFGSFNGEPAFWSLAAAVLAVASQGGDLAESALKRRCGVKDSGRLIPGHGGILDRIDGLMVAAPMLALFQAIHGM